MQVCPWVQVHVLCASGAVFVVCPIVPWGSAWRGEAVAALYAHAPQGDGGRCAAWLNQVGSAGSAADDVSVGEEAMLLLWPTLGQARAYMLCWCKRA